jgi:hypothetical protein
MKPKEKVQNISQVYLTLPRRFLNTNLAATGNTCDFHPKEIFLVPISVSGSVDSRVIVQPEGLSQCKVSMTPPGIETTAFWFVA